MKTTIEIKDDKKIELIHHLRGKKTAKEFLTMCVDAGLGVALNQLQNKQKKNLANMPVVSFPAADPAFKMLKSFEVRAALEDRVLSNPINIEVARLVKVYTSQLRDMARKSGNKLPRGIKALTTMPIEKIALDITASIISNLKSK